LISLAELKACLFDIGHYFTHVPCTCA